MSPCSLGEDFWAIASFLLQWKQRQRVHTDEPGGMCAAEIAFFWVSLGAKIAVEMCWARRGLGVVSGISITAKCGTWTKELCAPEGRKALSKTFPGQKLSRQMNRAFLVSCCHLPSAAHCRLPLLLFCYSALRIELESRVKHLTNRRLHKQLINNNFAD